MKKNILWGIILIAIGFLFLGNNLGLWDIDIFFKGWWTLFIIIPSLIELFSGENFWSSIFGIIIGLLLLAVAQDIITWKMFMNLFIPVMIIIIGLSLLFKPKPLIKRKNGNVEKNYIGIFSSCEESIDSNLEDSNCVAIFGGVDLDLRDSKIKNDIIIYCTSIFGGIDIKVPSNVNIETNGIAIFGGIENKIQKRKKDTEKATIYIHYVSIFAGIDII